MIAKEISFAAAAICIFVLLSPSLYAIGIAPAKTSFEFKPGAVYEGRFRIVSDEIPSKIVLTAEGELGKYVKLEKDVVTVEQPDTYVNFRLELPQDLPPGERSGGIMVLQIPKDTARENVVIATTAIVHQVRVNVPYPGKYLTGKVYITNTKPNDNIIFTIALANWGRERIDKINGRVTIKGPTNEEIASFSTDEISIEPGQESKILGNWKTEYEGAYHAEIIVDYDNKILELSESFKVGSQDIEIERLDVSNFKIGQIAKLDILLRNRWNQPVNVEGRVEVYKSNKMISSFNSVPVSVPSRSTEVMNAYWNTEGIDVGEYDILVKAGYNGNSAEKIFNSQVSIDSIKAKDSISGQVAAKQGAGGTSVLVISVIILIVLNILLFLYINKKLKANRQ